MNVKNWCCPLLIGLLVGCVTTSSKRLHPDEEDSIGGTGIESTDVRSVAQQMARSIVVSRAVQHRQTPPRILILSVRNRTRFRIDTEIFTVMIRDILIENAGDKVRFLDRFSSELPGEKESDFEKRLSGVDYYLKGELHSISKSSTNGISDWVVYSFQLIDKQSSDIILSKSHEIKKEGIFGVIYR